MSADRVAADLRRTELMRPECLLSVRAVADRLCLSASTVHHAISAGELRWHLFGSVRRVRPEDLEAYIQKLRATRPPADEDWCKVVDLMRATGLSRSHAYRLLERGVVPFHVFAGVQYVRRRDIAAFVQSQEKAAPTSTRP